MAANNQKRRAEQRRRQAEDLAAAERSVQLLDADEDVDADEDAAVDVDAAVEAAAHPGTEAEIEIEPPVAPVIDTHTPPELPARSGELVTVFSPKGGVGTSFLAVNLATALRDHGTVCLLDLDLEFGDLAIMTGLSPSRGIADAVGQDLSDDTALNRLITRSAAGPDCILAPVDPAAAEQVTAQLVGNLLSRCRSSYDYVVVDTPSQLSEQVLESLDASTHHVLVTSPDLPALKNLRLMLDTLDLLGMDPERRSVVLNRHDTAAGLQPAEVEAAIRTKLSMVIRTSTDVPVSIDEGQPLLGRVGKHPVARAIRSFAETTVVGVPAHPGRRPFRRGSKTRTRSA